MNIIALTGKMGTGKTTVLEILQEFIPEHTYYKFAGPIYQAQEAVYQSLGLPYEPGKLKDRKLLQVLGTEWGRDKDPRFWVNIWKENVQYAKGTILTDDCRFLNEATAIKELGGKIWRVEGPQRGGYLVGKDHPSEQQIDLIDADVVIKNTGSVEDLRESIHSNLFGTEEFKLRRGSRV